MNFNKIILIGRIATDLNQLQTNEGTKYSKFNIAIKRAYKNDKTDFIPVVVWGQQSEFVNSYLEKGSLILIEGKLFVNNYVSKITNQNTVSYEVSADRVENLETKQNVEFRKKQKKLNKNVDLNTENNQNTKTSFDSKDQIIDSNSENTNEENNNDIPWDLDL